MERARTARSEGDGMRRTLDPALFESVVREHHAQAFRAARRVARDEAAANDATAEVFRRVLEGRLDISGARDLGKLLRCAAAREASMGLRSERARARREAEVAMQRNEREQAKRETTEARELAERLAQEVEQLPDELRHALALRFGEGMTFAEVGTALAISEPSAHGRVQRALEKLRERLGKLGFAAVLPELGEHLARLEAPKVPHGLEARLLALKPAAFALSPLALGALVLVAASSTAAILLLEDREPLESVANAGTTGLERPTESVPVGEGRVEVAGASSTDATNPENPDEKAAKFAPARLEGRVLDTLGLAVAGAEVRASSVRREGKMALLGARATTDRNGLFTLELPVGLESGEVYALDVHAGSLHHEDGLVRASAGAELPLRNVQLREELLDQPGEWSLDVTVVDEAGRPVPKAHVYVYKPARNGASTWLDHETGATCDANGFVRLKGSRIGPKVVRVERRDDGFAVLRERVELSAPGALTREFRLARGTEIVARILDENGAPAAAKAVPATGWVQLYATDGDSNEWFHARVVDPEHVAISALAPVPHTLRFKSESHSSFTLHGVVPGGPPLEFKLKPRGETRDVGTHDAEIHGSVVHAATGAPVALDVLDIDLVSVPDDSPALRDGDWWPLYDRMRIAQVAQIESDGVERPPPHTFVHDGLPAGRYLVAVTVMGFAPTFEGPFELGPRDIVGPLEIRLTEGLPVRGRVLEKDGKAAEKAWIAILGPGELSRAELAETDAELRKTGGEGFLYHEPARADAAGSFTISRLPSGRDLRAVALHPEREPGPPVPFEPGATTTLELRLGARRSR
jgi:RNA polymerase sigma-70 factor (ECF subfamily)